MSPELREVDGSLAPLGCTVSDRVQFTGGSSPHQTVERGTFGFSVINDYL